MKEIEVYEIKIPTFWQEMKPLGDLMANGIVLATLLEWLPVVAAIVSLLWGLMRVYETFLDIRKKHAVQPFPAAIPVVLQQLKTKEKADASTRE